MDKILTFQTSNEKGIFLYTVGEGRDHGYLTKTASAEFHPEISKYIDQAKPIIGKTQLLLTALGAGEFWGSNINGDFFPVEALRHHGDDYGYKTFELYAKVYKHHVNKEPDKAYGDVILSVWNEKMKRVELIIILDNLKAPDLVERIDNAEYPEVSMGCKVPFDVCSCCKKMAKTRADYCDHLRYYMNQIPPGFTKKAVAINTFPKFFDISFVLLGADRIAKVLKKVASAYSQYRPSSAEAASTMQKLAYGLSRVKVAERKLAEIEKEIPSNISPNTIKRLELLGRNGVEALQPLEPEIPKRTIIMITSMGAPGPENLDRVLSTLGMLGILPKPQEFQQIALRALGKGPVADELESKGRSFLEGGLPSAEAQEQFNKQINIAPQNFDPGIFDLVKGLLAERSYAKPLLQARVIKLVKLAESGKLHYPKMTKTAEFADKREPLGYAPIMLALAGLYVAMKQKTPEATLSGIDKLISERPGVAAALGIGTITGLNALFSRQVKGKYDSNPDSAPLPNLTWQEDIARKNMNPITKTGTSNLASFGRRAILGAPALYMLSEAAQLKRERNPYEPEGYLSGIIRKYPDLLSLGLAGEALAGQPITKAIGQGLSGLKFLSKSASLSEDMKSTAIYSLAFPGASLPVRTATWAIDQGIMSGIEKLLTRKRKQFKGV